MCVFPSFIFYDLRACPALGETEKKEHIQVCIGQIGEVERGFRWKIGRGSLPLPCAQKRKHRQAFAGPIDKRPRTAREWRAQKTENCAHDNYRNC